MQHRKDKVLEALRLLCTQQTTHDEVSHILRRHAGFSAEEVAEEARVDRTNASRDLNQLAQEGIIRRISGRPVLFSIENVEHTPSALTLQVAASSVHRAHNGSGEQPSYTTSIQSAETIIQSHKMDIQNSIAASIQQQAVATSFETLIGYNDGLKVAVQQAKAAILYPPRGLHTLLYGPSGVGKTTMAKLMHSFALEQHALAANAPFISFNCADYAGNSQLLMAHLFGVVKGAYTGADRDRAGLVENAHHGILFLDEVHRLPPEGQEMLFYLMDRERFRRLGDTHERQASLLLLAATTEDPATSLLPTFRRRIPMTITLPGLHERTITERYELIRTFFTMECSSIGVSIQVTSPVLRAFLLYECIGNIGQLHTDIQLTCAHAYLDYRTRNLPELHVSVDALPEHVRRGLLRTAELHRTFEPLQAVLETTHSFTPTGLQLGVESSRNLYDTISNELLALRNSGLSEQEIHHLLHFDIQHYFQRFAETLPDALSNAHNVHNAQGIPNTLEAEKQATPLIDEHVMAVSHNIIHYAEEQLQRNFPEKLALVLTLHLMSAIEHTTQGQQIAIPALQTMHHIYPIEYEVARAALMSVRSILGVALPESETDVLTVLLANANTLLSSNEASIGIVVAAHGRGVAAGFAELANTLTGIGDVAFVELTLDQSPEELLTQVEQGVISAHHGRGVLLLVDFSSLLSLGELVTQRTGIQVYTLANVSMPLVVEALREAQQHNTLEQLASALLRVVVPPSRESQERSNWYTNTSAAIAYGSEETPRVILSVCLTGFGSATKLAELLEERLPELRQQSIEILCMDINLSGKTEADVQRLVGNRQVVAVVGTINPRLESYPFLSLTEVLFGDGIARLRTLLGNTLIDPALLQRAPTLATPIFTQRNELLREISYTLGQRMLFLNPMRAIPLIERMIELIEVEVGETFELEVLAGFVMHIACIMERGVQQPALLVNEKIRQRIEQQFPRELSISRHALQILSSQVARSLPDEEAYNIVGILRQVDIFFGTE